MKISVAIPDSALDDESTRLEKTRKASVIARSCAIFGVDTIYVYANGASKSETSLLTTILRYAETPQYLCRRLFPRVNELKYAGVVHPLQIPSHTVTSDITKIKAGHVRDGVVTIARGAKFLDVGLNTALPYRGTAKSGSRITIKFRSSSPDYTFKEITRGEVEPYWGYETRYRGSLLDLLRSWEGKIILTSRKGKPNTDGIRRLQADVLVAFGTRDKGILDILGSGIGRIQNAQTFNFFPNQRSATVRLEEAIFGALAMMDSMPRQDGKGITSEK